MPPMPGRLRHRDPRTVTVAGRSGDQHDDGTQARGDCHRGRQARRVHHHRVQGPHDHHLPHRQRLSFASRCHHHQDQPERSAHRHARLPLPALLNPGGPAGPPSMPSRDRPSATRHSGNRQAGWRPPDRRQPSRSDPACDRSDRFRRAWCRRQRRRRGPVDHRSCDQRRPDGLARSVAFALGRRDDVPNVVEVWWWSRVVQVGVIVGW